MDKDYIKRSDALEQLESIDWYHVNRDGKLVSGATSHDDPFVRYDAVEQMLKALPAVADVRPVVRTIPTISNTEYIDTGISASICNEWKTLQDDEEMFRAVGAKGESVTIDRKNKTLTCTDECGHTVIMNALKIIKGGEIVWSKDGQGDE